MTSQVAGLKEWVNRASRSRPNSKIADRSQTRAGLKTIAVTGGKGGVGKSNISLNLSLALARQGKKVLLFDADLGLANIDILTGVYPSFHLGHVVNGECALAEALFPLYPNITLVPGRSGLNRLADLDSLALEKLLRDLESLESRFDCLVLDTAAGISQQVAAFVKSAQQTILVTTPEPTAFMDAYASLKVCCGTGKIGVVVNMCRKNRDGYQTFNNLRTLSKNFLKKNLEFWGSIEYDYSIKKSIAEQAPVFIKRPQSAFSRQMLQLAKKVCGDPLPKNPGSFFGKLKEYYKQLKSKVK